MNPWLGFLTGWVMLLDYLLLPMVCYLLGVAEIPRVAVTEAVADFHVGGNALAQAYQGIGRRIFDVSSRIVMRDNTFDVTDFPRCVPLDSEVAHRYCGGDPGDLNE